MGISQWRVGKEEASRLRIFVGWIRQHSMRAKPELSGYNDFQIHWRFHVSIINCERSNRVKFFNRKLIWHENIKHALYFRRICGPFAVLMSYLSEFHGLKYRSRVMMSTGIFFSIASILLPLLALVIIPNPSLNFEIVANFFRNVEFN